MSGGRALVTPCTRAQAAQQVLDTPELVANIVAYVADSEELGPPYASKTAFLAALALTSVTFCYPAVKPIWRHQDLRNLLKCLPASGLRIKNGALIIQPGMSDRDWERVHFYGPFIHELTVTGFTAAEAIELSGIIEALRAYGTARSSISGWLLPRLTALTLNLGGACTAMVAGLMVLLGPQVEVLNLRLMPSYPELSAVPDDPILADIMRSEVCLVLQSLFNNAYPGVASQNLVSLDLVGYEIDLHTIQLIARLPRLRKLKVVWTHPIFPNSRPALDPLDPHFPLLEELFIVNFDESISYHDERLADLSVCTDLLKAFRPRSLKKLTAMPWFMLSNAGQLHQFFACLKDLDTQCPLREIALTSEFHWDSQRAGNYNNETIRLHHITPVLSCHKLERFTLNFGTGGYVRFRDEDFRRFAASWPKLKAISLLTTCATAEDSEPPPTLRALVFLVNGCPLLRNIVLSFKPRVSTSVIAAYDTSDRRSNPSIEELGVGYTYVSWDDKERLNTARLATFLSELFPNLRRCTRTVHPYDNDHDQTLLLWDQVERHLRRIRQDRELLQMADSESD